MRIGVSVGHVHSRWWRVTMLHSQQNLPLTRLKQFEDCVLTSSHCVVVIDGEDLVSCFDAAVEESRLALHHFLYVHPRLVG